MKINLLGREINKYVYHTLIQTSCICTPFVTFSSNLKIIFSPKNVIPYSLRHDTRNVLHPYPTLLLMPLLQGLASLTSHAMHARDHHFQKYNHIPKKQIYREIG